MDGLHQRAGSTDVVEFHGNLFVDRCSVEGTVVEGADHEAPVPICPACGGLLRPGVVWFGESIPKAALDAAVSAAADCDLFLSIGTSSQVWPAAGLADTARQAGATIVEINRDRTPLTASADFVLTGRSGEILPVLVGGLAASDGAPHP